MAIRHGWTTIGVAALLVGAIDMTGSEALRLQLTPAVSRAPALVTVRVTVPHAADNRRLQVVAESGDFYRSSEVPLDGEHAPPLSIFEFRNLPPGLYQVTGVLIGVGGERGRVSGLAKVEPQFGGGR
ncbi:MAG TPA: hypothetical protein VKE51_20060 [Vicinamibacterales bacterium]|nr:hypothetical protein [Vicinamibacterales bacterium]